MVLFWLKSQKPVLVTLAILQLRPIKWVRVCGEGQEGVTAERDNFFKKIVGMLWHFSGCSNTSCESVPLTPCQVMGLHWDQPICEHKKDNKGKNKHRRERE